MKHKHFKVKQRKGNAISQESFFYHFYFFTKEKKLTNSQRKFKNSLFSCKIRNKNKVEATKEWITNNLMARLYYCIILYPKNQVYLWLSVPPMNDYRRTSLLRTIFNSIYWRSIDGDIIHWYNYSQWTVLKPSFQLQSRLCKKIFHQYLTTN